MRARLASMISSVNGNNGGGKTELDSHANMMVFGNTVKSYLNQGKLSTLEPFQRVPVGINSVIRMELED